MREKLIKLVDEVLKCLPWGEVSSHTAKDIADHLIANDIEPVVRCKDCTCWEKAKVNKKGFLICPVSGMQIMADDFCSRGRKEQEE